MLLHGYNYAVNVLALLAAKSKGLPVLMRSDTHLGLQRKRWIRDAALSRAYRFLDGFLAVGAANRTYYRSLGLPDEKIFDAPLAVDNARFMAGAALTPEERAEVRRTNGLPEEGTVVLYASKLMRRKRPDDVICAMASLRDKGRAAILFMGGAGEMEQELRDLSKSLGMEKVVFGGFINQAELPMVYAVSDIFVFPSENEPFGLIVNEVMCAGFRWCSPTRSAASPTWSRRGSMVTTSRPAMSDHWPPRSRRSWLMSPGGSGWARRAGPS